MNIKHCNASVFNVHNTKKQPRGSMRRGVSFHHRDNTVLSSPHVMLTSVNDGLAPPRDVAPMFHLRRCRRRRVPNVPLHSHSALPRNMNGFGLLSWSERSHSAGRTGIKGFFEDVVPCSSTLQERVHRTKCGKRRSFAFHPSEEWAREVLLVR